MLAWLQPAGLIAAKTRLCTSGCRLLEQVLGDSESIAGPCSIQFPLDCRAKTNQYSRRELQVGTSYQIKAFGL